MSDEVKVNLTRLSVTFGVLGAAVALFGAWFILPYRVNAAEAEISTLKLKVESQSIILARIDENVKQLKEAAAARRDRD